MNPEEVKKLVRSTANLDTTYFGSRTSNYDVEENVGIDDDQRMLHTLEVGPTGYGKTQVMVHAALQDAEKGHGFCMVIPKGEAIEDLLGKLPEDRLDDVIYVNPAGEQVPAINVLEAYVTEEMTEAQRENQKEIIVSDLIDLFKRQSENWGDRFGRVLETLLRAHINLNIKHEESNSLIDVFECVVNSDALTELIDRVGDDVVREQLVRIREDMGSHELEPLQRRLNDFTMNSTIRKVISSRTSAFDFQEAIEDGKIILVDVQKGEIGETVAQLVGSVVITKVWAAAQSRITQPFEDRSPFHLYVDELHNFAGEGSNFASILAEAREYRLGCWVIIQYVKQLPPEMRRAVINNCRTKIVFNPVGSEDISKLTGMLRGVTTDDLQALGEYRAVVQTPGEREQTRAVVVDTYPPWDPGRDAEAVKREAAVGSADFEDRVGASQSLGRGANAGGEKHQELLMEAKNRLEVRGGVQVNLLYQDQGADKPDGHVMQPDDSIAYLEAEHSTLSKPVKVLTNYQRAIEDGKPVIFVVEDGNATKLRNIITDPVNRQGTDHEDEQGSYSYYTGSEDEMFTDTERLRENDQYRILELEDDDLVEYDTEQEPDCPELGQFDREELEQFCMHRDDDGFCTALGQPCVLNSG